MGCGRWNPCFHFADGHGDLAARLPRAFPRPDPSCSGRDADTVTLLRPNGDIADRYTYTRGPGADASHCRIPDGVGSWTSGCQPTLGAVNRLALPPPSATATPASRKSESDAQPTAARHSDASVNVTIWAARRMAEGAQITISGTVTMAPGPLGRRIYVEDETEESGSICKEANIRLWPWVMSCW